MDGGCTLSKRFRHPIDSSPLIKGNFYILFLKIGTVSESFFSEMFVVRFTFEVKTPNINLRI